MKVNQYRIESVIETLANFNDTPDKGVTRFSYSENDRAAKDYLMNIFNELSLKVSVDAIGNIRARYEGKDPSLSPILIGSHIDSVRNGGKYDGIIGVVGAIEVIRVLVENNYKPNRSIEVIIFAEEEGSNFGTTMVGSKALVGKLDVSGLKKLKNNQDQSCYDVVKDFGINPDEISNCLITKDDVYAMIELHIEQGIVLEKEQKKLGIVEVICGMKTIRITVEGVSNHAGATPMNFRQDPLVAVAEFISSIEKAARYYVLPTTVATVGEINCSPNMPNVIPKSVTFTVDIRDVEQNGIDEMINFVDKELKYIIEKYNVTASYNLIGESKCIELSKKITDVIENSITSLNIPYMRMNSGAVHDAAMFAQVTDVGMIFVPSRDGKSHNAEEYSSYEDIALGCLVLLNTVIELAQ